MSADLLLDERHVMASNAFVEMLVWRVPHPVRGSRHHLKYSFAYVVDGKCVLRYDNEAGKGDHRHIGEVETPYVFSTPHQLVADFWKDVDAWRPI